MKSAGFEVSSSEYINRQTVNKKEGLEVPRIFVQGKFAKPVGGDMSISECDPVRQTSKHCGSSNQQVKSCKCCHSSGTETPSDSGANPLSSVQTESAVTEKSCNLSSTETCLCDQNNSNKLSKLTLETMGSNGALPVESTEKFNDTKIT